MTTPSNIERFNELTARVLADLYQAFPVPREVFSAHYATPPEHGTEGQPDEATEFFAADELAAFLGMVKSRVTLARGSLGPA